MPSIARAGDFIDPVASGGGSVSAQARILGLPPPYPSAQTAAFAGVNNVATAGTTATVFSSAANSLISSISSISAGVSSFDTYNSYVVYSAAESASVSLSFQVSSAGLYTVTTSGFEPSTSGEIRDNQDMVSLTGVSSSGTVLTVSQTDGASVAVNQQGVASYPQYETPFMLTLTAGTEYTLILNSSAQNTDDGEGADSFANFSIVEVPEPAFATALLAVSLTLQRRHRHEATAQRFARCGLSD